ncbi:methionyl-tRNA formyltransferase [Candidatus Peribacteria bacterium]|jgi:methionyl-tRNA formyltransferase|nr:methionyl-tRNA formyltransferase [Candidatus Peribacteria bacterium]MBT4020780.1 methionyl-tRNA formyltransferase [Candidatus Peribacteria bacterium]MBT4241060.1 methionyl-tRNA formyltransferase [Candidatus Peribacteria bacterium]MBT4474441.1 methionyl-tRNA formyltransferase [Candidatus Peribacteria bacterium]
MSKHSVIFFGTPEFACPTLQALNDDGNFEVSLVITQPDKPVGRKQEITPPSVKDLAIELGIPVFQTDDINKDFAEIPRHVYKPPDFLVVVAFGQILSKAILKVPKVAAINVHASLLPRWRGASPIQNSIMSGDEETGATVQRMEEEFDTGPVLAQSKTKIEKYDTTASLGKRLSEIGADLLTKTIKKNLPEKEQDKSEATYCKKLTRESGIVSPSEMTAEEIDRYVRALVPWPGVTISSNDKKIKLIETSLSDATDSIELKCKDDTTLNIIKLQAPGRNIVSGKEGKNLI